MSNYFAPRIFGGYPIYSLTKLHKLGSTSIYLKRQLRFLCSVVKSTLLAVRWSYLSLCTKLFLPRVENLNAYDGHEPKHQTGNMNVW
jgi:hypothetical protein